MWPRWGSNVILKIIPNHLGFKVVGPKKRWSAVDFRKKKSCWIPFTIPETNSKWPSLQKNSEQSMPGQKIMFFCQIRSFRLGWPGCPYFQRHTLVTVSFRVCLLKLRSSWKILEFVGWVNSHVVFAAILEPCQVPLNKNNRSHAQVAPK